MKYQVVIPARMGATRLPGKPLIEIAGKPLVQHVWERCQESGAESVTIATDSEQIRSAAVDFGAQVAMTRSDHQSGTDRIAEVATQMGWQDELIVNVQGDEPLMPPEAMDQVARCLCRESQADMATLATPITDEAEWRRTDCVKVVTDRAGFALLFSRAPIPHRRGGGMAAALRHLGIYGYRADRLRRLVVEPPCELELSESLEQLRALWIGQRILVEEAVAVPPPGIDTEDDIALVEAMLLKRD